MMIIYTVKPGDSIYQIAKKYGVSPDKIIADNAIQNPQRLMVGQSLAIMTNNISHTVTSGDSLYSLAGKYNISVDDILGANPEITDPGKLNVGQIIIIPLSSQKLGSIDVNGFVYPNIKSETLNKILPYLTYISIFSYMVKADGSLNEIDDEDIITQARAKKVAPLMVITNLKEGGGFDSELASTILTDENAQNNLIENIIKTLAKGYYGVNIDFEYIKPEDVDNYNNFVVKMSETLKPLGYIVTTSLAPKTSASQKGILYEAHDYAFHGKAADLVILMTYEWGYSFGPPLAVAPLNQVKKVLDYAVTVIPGDKILMGMPNYGYDWTLPYEKGTAAKVVSNTGAVNIASQRGARINFDEDAQSPYFYYYDDNGKQHVVWFEDARSIEAKLKLVDEYDLAGVSYWTLSSYFPQNWLVLSSMYNINKVL